MVLRLSPPPPRSFPSPFRGRARREGSGQLRRLRKQKKEGQRPPERESKSTRFVFSFQSVDRASFFSFVRTPPTFFPRERTQNNNSTMDDRFKFMCTLLVGHTVRAKVSGVKKERGSKKSIRFFFFDRRPALVEMMMPSNSFFLSFSRPSSSTSNIIVNRPRKAPSTKACSRA